MDATEILRPHAKNCQENSVENPVSLSQVVGRVQGDVRSNPKTFHPGNVLGETLEIYDVLGQAFDLLE